MQNSRLLAAGSNWLAFALTLAVAFALTPAMIAALGPERYDVWCVAEAVLAYVTLLDMGLAACLVRAVARHNARAEHTDLNRIASGVFVLFSAAAVVAVVVGTPVMLVVAPTLAAKAGPVTPFLLLMLLNVALTLPLSLFPSILDGLECYVIKSVVRIVFLALRTFAIIVANQHLPELFTMAIILTVSNLLEHAVMIVLVKRQLSSFKIDVTLVDQATLKEVRTSSVDAFLAMLAGRVTVQTGTILIGVLLPGGQVTLFATAARLVEYSKTLLRTITATLTPGVSALEARGDWPAIRSLFLTATRWLLYLALPIQLGLWFFGKPFLIRWVPQVGAAGFVPLAILTTTLTLAVAQSVASRLLYGLGRLRLFARLALVEAAVHLGMLALLIQHFETTGVALAVTIPNLLFCGAVIAYTLRVIDVTWSVYATAWLKPMLASALPVVVWTLLPPTAAAWDSIALGIAAGLMPYAMAVLLLEAPRRLTLRVRTAVRRLAPAASRGRTPTSAAS